MTNYIDIIKESFNVKYPEDTLYPSEIGICFRRSYLSRKLTFQKRINEIYMDLGNQYHHHIESYLVEKLNCKSEIEIQDTIENFKISARIDLICGNDLIELKTVSYDTYKIKEYHLLQVALYYYLLQKQNYKIDNIYIIYLNRTTKEVEQFNIDKNLLNSYIEKALNWIKQFANYIKYNNYKKIPGINNKFCTNCEFINYCYGKLF